LTGRKEGRDGRKGRGMNERIKGFLSPVSP